MPASTPTPTPDCEPLDFDPSLIAELDYPIQHLLRRLSSRLA
jgi:hypothetical protein